MPLRYEQKNTCGECGDCRTAKHCDPARRELRDYSGVRFTSDGFDCALPVAIDSFSHCSYACDYCFSDNLAIHREQTRREIGATPLTKVENLFAGRGGKYYDDLRKALKYDDRNENGYPCPVQLGAICDPMDNIERQQGWFLDFVDLAIRYDQPVRVSTKGNLALIDEYRDALARHPELFWVTFSIISPDDELLPKVDKRAPKPSERIECMRRLSDVGVTTSLRFRPIIPGLSDSTPDYPDAYRTLIEQAGDAGAEAISYETAFLAGMATEDIRERYRNMEEVTGKPLRKIYNQFGKKVSCMRPSYRWTEGIMKGIRREAKNHDLNVGISDPVWAQLGDYGCCCGISPDHPVFGNWERENAKNALLRAKRGEIEKIRLEDITPPWSHDVLKDQICSPGVGPKVLYRRRHTTWADNLEELWNDLDKERGPYRYFQGALKPVDRDENGDLVYRYEGLPDTGRESYPYWDL